MKIIKKIEEKKALIVLTAVRAVCEDSQEVAYFVGVQDNPYIPSSHTIKTEIAKNGWKILSEDDEWIERWEITIELPKGFCFCCYKVTSSDIVTYAIFKDTRYKDGKLHMCHPFISPVRCEMVEHDNVVQPDIASAIEKIAQSGICLCMDNSSDKMIAQVISKELIAKYPSSYK
ncbi:MAG TPA: hypothetical protein H9890_03395 [Candidatus Faecalibacterium intestinigallinarum]|uniref:Uncharacterized protein n=1 Tax=Candidatus Faecalibacterium intestinigallinarum TaxID=2838581 RepID=A0A9D1TVZ8_9FIRM|nr:hypothetical protein [Candidatus Faecalibacterium intestinigallinarum]